MDSTENALCAVIFTVVFFVVAILGFAVVYDTRPQCWISKAPFVCEEVYKLKETKGE